MTNPSIPIPIPRLRPSPAVTLTVVLAGFLTLPMLMSGTTVAMPRIGADLNAAGASLQWVVSGYFLAVASFGLVAGSLGDLFGRRRVFVAGLSVYLVGVTLSAAAPTILALDVARVVSGVGGGAVMTTGAAILAQTFTGRARNRAFAAMGTIAGVGMAVGPTLSGLLVELLDWRLTFALFAVVAAAMLTGTLFMAPGRREGRPRIDKAGVATFVAGLAALMYGVTQGAKSAWTDAVPLTVGAAALALLAAFVLIERKVKTPVLDLALLRDRGFLGWLLAAVTLAVGVSGLLVSLPGYLQGAGGVSPRTAGLMMLMMTVPILVVPQIAAFLINKGVPARALIGVALLAIAGGNAWLTTLSADLTGLLGPLALIGAGNGLAAGMIDAQAMGRVSPDRVGMASGLLGTIRGAGNALVMSAFGAVLIALTARAGDPEAAARAVSGKAEPALTGALTDAWHAVSWATAALAAAGALTVIALLRVRKP
ncbi:MFS transporter [Actinorhabdospora filicis]|uniref:MFS transporter n=1 Tax=Actinorhabdospora filicis TaxID=1785913 RepID=A0A9W6SQK6_9ACTN|nr:MFS transporter [Actinorhabdospora filicis]GLZ80538.1 MFS transporter [Actinorhabdospora filicis]